MQRRLFMVSALSAAFLLLAAFTASATGGGEKAPAGGPPITYAYWGDQNEEVSTTALLKAFMEKNPTIKVTGQRFGTNTEFNDKITTLAAGGTLPDVSTFYEPNVLIPMRCQDDTNYAILGSWQDLEESMRMSWQKRSWWWRAPGILNTCAWPKPFCCRL